MEQAAEFLAGALELAALAIDAAGIALILIGAAKFAFRAAAIEFERLRGLACVRRIRANRVELGGYILAALEFMIVSDIIHSVLSRELNDLLLLGLLVVIRTGISFFLGLELKEVEREDPNPEPRI